MAKVPPAKIKFDVPLIDGHLQCAAVDARVAGVTVGTGKDLPAGAGDRQIDVPVDAAVESAVAFGEALMSVSAVSITVTSLAFT